MENLPLGRIAALVPEFSVKDLPLGKTLMMMVLGLNLCVLCVLSCVVSGGGPDIVLTTRSARPALVYLSSVLVHNLLLPLQASDTWAFEL